MPLFQNEEELTPHWREFLHLKRLYAARFSAHKVLGTDHEVREMVRKGATLLDIARHYNTSDSSARNFCRAWGILPPGVRWRAPSPPPDLARMRKYAYPKGTAPNPPPPEEPPALPPITIPPHLLPSYLKVAAHDPLVWAAIQKAGVEHIPPPPGAAADAQTAGLDEEED